MGWRAVLGAGLRLGPRLGPDRAPEGAAREADRALRERDAREREALRRRAALPAPQPRDPRRARLPRPHRARGVRRPRREPRRLLDGLRDARPLRLRLDRHVLRDAHRRGGDDHAAPDRRAGRQVHPPARLGGKIGTLSYSDPETGSHFWYPFSSSAERSNGGYKVNKKASWTTSGGFADFYVVQTTSPDFTGYDDLSVFVIDGDDVAGPAVALGRARPARQPVRPDPGAGRRDPRRPDRRPARRRRRVQRRGRSTPGS